MTARRNRPFDLSPLGHPAWWGALALLLVNDNLLKGRHVVPGWLTGKLSDFAFLIVAPVLLAALLPVAVRARRTVAMLSAVGVFVAKDLSAPFSDEVVALAGQVGLHWRLWSDPTDLLALLVLPLTARIMWGDSDAKTTPRRPMRLACERFGGLVGAVACLATSAGPSFPHSPFFVNRLPTTAALRMTWVLRDIDCQATAASVAASLLPSDLDDPITLSVGSGQVATLDGPSPPGTSPVGLCSFKASASQACVGVIVESGTASPVLMVAPMQWVSFDGASICQSSFGTSANPGPDALSLGSVNGVPTFAAGSMLQIAPLSPADVVPRTPQADGCRPTRAAYEGLVSQDTCATATDCQALPPLPAVNGGPCAFVYANTAVSPAAVQSLVTQWQSACLSFSAFCGSPQTAVCRAGVCGALCPGVVLSACPPPCSDFGVSPGAACNADVECITADRQLCSCPDGQEVCTSMAPASASCPLPCLGWPFTAPDGPAEAGADAGANVSDTGAGTSDGPDNEASADADTTQ